MVPVAFRYIDNLKAQSAALECKLDDKKKSRQRDRHLDFIEKKCIYNYLLYDSDRAASLDCSPIYDVKDN